jgi:hypothetical protein
MLRTQLKIDSGYYYCEAQNWSKDKPDAFAGVHSQVGLLLSFDEASGIDDISVYHFPSISILSQLVVNEREIP